MCDKDRVEAEAAREFVKLQKVLEEVPLEFTSIAIDYLKNRAERWTIERRLLDRAAFAAEHPENRGRSG